MRLLAAPVALPLLLLVGVVVVTNVLRPPPAADRLAGVTVALVGYRLEGAQGLDRRLRLTVRVSSARDLDECLGFTLDEPFAGRRLDPDPAGCVRPRAGTEDVAVVLGRLTEDDERFPDHTLVWGIPGGRCGPVLEVVGVCVVEQAGAVDVKLPGPPGLPTIGPLGSFPLFSFPAFSFEP